jgi:hypothetical protein
MLTELTMGADAAAELMGNKSTIVVTGGTMRWCAGCVCVVVYKYLTVPEFRKKDMVNSSVKIINIIRGVENVTRSVALNSRGK